MRRAFFTGLLLTVCAVSSFAALDNCEQQVDGTRLAHPFDCSKFITCQSQRMAITGSCPTGLHFNRELSECDFKSKAGCVYPVAAGSADVCCDCDCSSCTNCSAPTPAPTPRPTAVPTPGPTPTPTAVPTPGPTPGPTPRPTPAPTPAPSGPGTGPSGTTCNQKGQCAGRKDGQMFANSKGYVVCQCECEIQMSCPPGLVFNGEVCDWPAGSPGAGGNGGCTGSGCSGGGGGNVAVECSNDSTLCKDDNSDGMLFPVQGVCNQFYKCSFGCAVPMNCPNNLIYNPTAKYCDYPQNYKCPWPYTPPSGPSAGPSGIACPSGGQCVDQNEGATFTSKTSGKYIVCQCGCEVEMSCPPGLVFNMKTKLCDYPNA